jgi:hypothetical protein
MGALSFGVAHAGGIGVAEGKDSVYVAAIVDHTQVVDPAVVRALDRYGVSAAVGTSLGAPTPTDVHALVGAGVTVLGTDTSPRTRNPKRLKDHLNAAAAAVAGAEKQPKVMCLRAPGVVERVVAWDHDLQLARPGTVLLGGELPNEIKAGDQVVLDERGRTPEQVTTDLAALASYVSLHQLPQEPMRALWRKG